MRLPVLFSICLLAPGQTKAPPTPADYGQWETLVSNTHFGDGLSPDGKWLAYVIDRSNGSDELRFANVATGTQKVIAFGMQAAFSPNSLWAAYTIGYSEAQQDKFRKDKKPIHNKLGLLNLTTGEQTVVDEIESFAFSPTGTFLAMRRYAPEKKDPAAPVIPPDEEPPSAGATLIVRQLATSRDTTFGNVSEFAWQDLRLHGHLLAMAINAASSADEKTGNGVQLFDSETGSLRLLDSASSDYSSLSWRKDSSDLAFLRSKSDDKHQGPISIALAWCHLGEPAESNYRYDPASDAKFPPGMRTVPYRKLTWSDNGKIVFLGMAQWVEKPPPAKKAATEKEAAADVDEPPEVNVWHWHDLDVMPKQKLNARNDSQRNMLAAWHPESGSLVQLGRAITEQVTPVKHQDLAWLADWKAYALDRTIGRPAADIYLVDLATGERRKIRDHLIEDRYVQASPGGRYLLYFQDDHYWTVDTATHAIVNFTKNIKASFVDRESDAAIKQKPAFGVAGWTKDDSSVILYDKFDLWQVSPDGLHAARLTDGAEDETRHRYIRLDQDDEFIDTSKPIYLSLFGIWTKKSGYARLEPGGGHDHHLLCLDKHVFNLAKAKNADVFSYVSETFEDSPNIFVVSPQKTDWKDAKQLTKTNEFQSKYGWGRSELVEYKNSHGERLQGALFYPAGYEAGRKYPMIVYLYEKLSDQLHGYSPLSERRYYDASAMTSHGYFLLMPDILFRAREPGVSVVDCVTAAVKKVLQKNVVDEQKIGVIGHSWGGFDTTYLATHTNIFAAAVAGAPITDLVSNYGNHHWSSGIAETDHIETGQQRMQVPLWEDLQAYIRNSAVFNVQNMTTPLLIEVGDSDGTVFFHQGVELYNIARRARKEVVMLVYAGEDHGLKKKPDQIDYQHRIFAWFGHYLKGESGPTWITDGQSYLDRQREVKALKPQ
jgi:dipeptidyl aminopeptidase/acylaminoacyl peptidase